MKGWVYVITNKAMPGLVKVGFSTKDPTLRARELNHTGSPHPYKVEYSVLVEEPNGVEQITHNYLSDYKEGKEWFRCSIQKAISAIKTVAAARFLFEDYNSDFITNATKVEPIQSEAFRSIIHSKRRKIFSRHELFRYQQHPPEGVYPWLKIEKHAYIKFLEVLPDSSSIQKDCLSVSYEDYLVLDKYNIVTSLFNKKTSYCAECATSVVPIKYVYDTLCKMFRSDIDYENTDDSELERLEQLNEVISSLLLHILFRVDVDWNCTEEIVSPEYINYEAVKDSDLLEPFGGDAGLYIFKYIDVVLSIGGSCDVCTKIYS